MSDRYVVAGNPVAHSRSPLIHMRFALTTGQDMEYRRLLVPLGGFARAATLFFADGGKGMNVTVPFKLDACRFAGHTSPRAAQAGAVNTLWFVDGAIHGDNTDGPGLVRDLVHNLGWTLAGARVLLLGAGGAVRGVLGPLLEQAPAAITVVNRTAARAQELAAAFGHARAVSGCGYEALADTAPFDLVINGTSASLHHEVPPLPETLLAGAACYDMAYADGPTPFLARAAAAGARACADGLGMLVEQAAEAFLLWRGVRPATGELIRDLRRGVRIRAAAGAADHAIAATLFREYRQWLGVDLCFQDFEAELATLPGDYVPPAGALLLACCGEEPAGCVAVRALGDGACEMKRLWVRPAYRGGGTGRALACAAIAAARAAGYRAVRLDTLGRLREAVALYTSLGFRRCAAYYDNPLDDVLYWELDLHATDTGERAP
ncbi:MAG: Shikimate dehydrogenase (NADP(+)) [Pseudomonadales bacterium]|nr:Shikimate dehydrogenase (NADP(+)) [Pseudomonadales bacterium]